MATKACIEKSGTIIIQNTHMRKWEMQTYLNMAAEYQYTVIMAITLYRFDVTPKALLANSTDGLNLEYFQRRLKQWENIPPFLTGWFFGPNDSALLQSLAFSALNELLHDGKFCRVYNLFGIDDITENFNFRRQLCCLAGLSENSSEMLEYYLGDVVQDNYGKCFTLTILGYCVSPDWINIIVEANIAVKSLLFDGGKYVQEKLSEVETALQSLEVNCNFDEHFMLTSYHNESQLESEKAAITAVFEEWDESFKIQEDGVTFIHFGQREEKRKVNIGQVREEYRRVLGLEGMISEESFSELDSGTKVCRLPNDIWIVKANKKISVQAIFTGLYL